MTLINIEGIDMEISEEKRNTGIFIYIHGWLEINRGIYHLRYCLSHKNDIFEVLEGAKYIARRLKREKEQYE